MHELPVITMLAGALAMALVLGWITHRLGLTTLVGYMLAGIVVGPHTPGFVADAQLASQLAEIGVILLMFGVGMHFHPRELLAVWRLAVPGAVAQSAVATIAGWAAARWLGWSHGAGLVFGMALAVASTVVLMRMLVEQDRLASREGHVAVGWLIVEDLFTVLALVMLPALAAPVSGMGGLAVSLGTALLTAVAFAALIWFGGTSLVSRVLERVARTRSAELFTLSVFVLALGVAILAAGVFHLSVALGAFLAGLVLGQSRFGAQAAADMAPFRDVFSALFFVSVGLLFDPGFVLREPWVVVIALAIVLGAKPLVAWGIVRLLGGSTLTAATVAVGLAQIGEFSFILAALARSFDILPAAGFDALVAAALLSVTLNPLLFRLLRRLGRSEPAAVEATPGSTVTGGATPVIIAGSGPLATRLALRCREAGIAACVVDADAEGIERLQAAGITAVFGDPGRVPVLEAAGAVAARLLVVASSGLPAMIRTCATVRQVNPHIAIVALADNEAERAWLREFGVTAVCEPQAVAVGELMRAVRAVL